jgi:hypothetical protein
MLAGAVIFVAVEGTQEEREQADLRRERYALLRQLRELTRDPVLADDDGMWEGRAVVQMHQFENTLYEAFKHGVTPKQNNVWGFWNAVFYCGTIYTTIGKSLRASTTDMSAFCPHDCHRALTGWALTIGAVSTAVTGFPSLPTALF